MDLDVPLESGDLRLHFRGLVKKLLSLLRLVFKLSRQLMVLQDRQPSGGLELLIIQSQEISFGLFNLVKHFFSEFLSSLDSFPLFVINFFELVLLLSFKLDF